MGKRRIPPMTPEDLARSERTRQHLLEVIERRRAAAEREHEWFERRAERRRRLRRFLPFLPAPH